MHRPEPQALHPILFHVGDQEVGTYALAILCALIAGVAVFGWLGKRAGHEPAVFVEMGLWAFVCAILSSKLFGFALNFDPADIWGSLKAAARFSGHFYVGFGAGVAFFVWAFRRNEVPLAKGLDILAPALALGHGIGRLGCLMAGCCWGKACDLPWAITFTSTEANRITGVPLNIPLHPTQLYECLGELLIFAVLLTLHLRLPRFPGSTILAYVLLYGSFRFGLEFVRDDPRGQQLLGGLSTSQVLALFSVVLAFVSWLALRKRHAEPAA